MPASELRILAATNNPDKLREISHIINGSGWTVMGLKDMPPYPETVEDGVTLLDNALKKAREGFQHSSELTLADDTGLEVDALDGRPGVRSARYAGPKASYDDNCNLLLKELHGVEHSRRTARFRTVMALVGHDLEMWWEGVSDGIILDARRGNDGFGYDPVFWSPELNMTFAEASLDEKNRVSHRGRALLGLIEKLRIISGRID